MINFKAYITEAGQESGKMELVKTPLEKAQPYAAELMAKNGRDLDKEIPDFDTNYVLAQKKAGTGKTMRKDMPVIDEKDIKDFQDRLAQGYIDINAPFTHKNNKSNPFPSGLTGDKAQQWLEDGLEIHDGDKNDDKVKVKIAKVRVGDLKPIQKQIYFDKSIEGTASFGRDGTKNFLQKFSTFIVSTDNYIIDGHHRMLSGMLLDPNLKVNCLVIDMPIKALLPMSLAYGDAVGNSRNK